MRNHSKQRYIYSWVSHDAFIQRAQGQEFVEVLSLWQNTSEIAMYFNCIHVSNCNVSKLFSISYSKKLLLFIMPFTGLISITSLITYLPKHDFGIISSYFRNCRWPYSKHHICIIGRKKPMHTVNWGYIENMFFTACTFYLTMKKNYEQWTNFYSRFSGQNWLVSLENLPAPWTHLKGHVHKHDATVAWEYPNLPFEDLHSTVHWSGGTAMNAMLQECHAGTHTLLTATTLPGSVSALWVVPGVELRSLPQSRLCVTQY